MNDHISKTGYIDKLNLINESQKKNTPAAKGEGSFGRILSEQLEINTATGEQTRPSGLSEIQSPLNIALTNASFNAEEYTQKLKNSLDLMETYAAFLSDPDKTLKQASELLDQLLNQMQGLEQELKTSDTPDADLNQILSQMLTTATLERIKMDRGDYLS